MVTTKTVIEIVEKIRRQAAEIIDAPTQIVEVTAKLGCGMIYSLADVAKQRGIQFREIRMEVIAPWDICDHYYLDDDGVVKIAEFDPLAEMKLDDGPAIVALVGYWAAAPQVIECYSAIASDRIKVISITYER